MLNWLPEDQVCKTAGFMRFQSLKSDASILPRFNLKPSQAVLVFQSAFFKLCGQQEADAAITGKMKQLLSSADVTAAVGL